MKIDSKPSLITAQLKPRSSTEAKNLTSNKSPQADVTITQQANQLRISKWFAQIGIQAGYTEQKSSAIEDKVRLKRKMLAQRRLLNLESILGRALDFCLDEGKEEHLDPDWFFSFVNMAEEIFSPAMQELWGKIFAVETAKPGSFSLKTLSILKQLTQKDAQIFRHAVNLASLIKGESTPKLLLGYYQKANIWALFSAQKGHKITFAEYGFGYTDILSLMDLGLLHHSEIESGELPLSVTTHWRCAGHNLHLQPKRTGTTLVYYKFTATGAELFKLVTRQKQDNYANTLKSTLSPAFVVQ
jgi:uncharacterized repeat protein (TIGR03899 family)